jgi:hypothetical protein
MNIKIIGTLLSLFCSTIVVSQTLSFRCNFTDGQITNFDSGAPSTKHESKFTELVFDQIDITKKTARLIGNVGVAQVQVIEGTQLIHLVEITNSGNLNLTSIFFTDKSKLSGAFPVVHSRHLKTSPSSPLPSQYIGLCRELMQ